MCSRKRLKSNTGSVLAFSVSLPLCPLSLFAASMYPPFSCAGEPACGVPAWLAFLEDVADRNTDAREARGFDRCAVVGAIEDCPVLELDAVGPATGGALSFSLYVVCRLAFSSSAPTRLPGDVELPAAVGPPDPLAVLNMPPKNPPDDPSPATGLISFSGVGGESCSIGGGVGSGRLLS